MTKEQKELLVARALVIMRQAHKWQKRRDGQPYETHPQAVHDILITRRFPEWGVFDSCEIEDQALLEILAYLHDVFEDNKAYMLTLESLQIHFQDQLPIAFCRRLYENLLLLTRPDDMSYAEYIARIHDMSWAAAMVKLADLTHNLSDNKPGSQKDKYMLAYYILTDGKQYTP